MTTSRARLEVVASNTETRVRAAAATQPQRWAQSRQTRDGWIEAIHQILGDGVFGGDVHRTSIVSRRNARLVVRGITATPARRGTAGANAPSATVTHLRAEAGSTLIHLPGALIPQAAANHTAALGIDVEAGARVLAATVIVPGRTGMHERGGFERLRMRTVARVGGVLAFAEDAEFCPSAAGIDGPAVFNGFDAAVSILALGAWAAADVGWWAGFGDARLLGGATALRSGGVCVRALARSLGDAQEALADIEARCRALATGTSEDEAVRQVVLDRA